MSAIINNIDMEDNEFRVKIQEMLAEQRRKDKETNRQYAQRTCQVSSQYTPSRSAPPPRPSIPTPPPQDGKDVRIQDLTEQNQELTKKYADLVKKANTLVEAYRELKTENETLKYKKAKRESATKVFSEVGKSFKSGYDKIILWFKT